MAKDMKAREMGWLSFAAIGIIMGATIDAMRAADVSNDVIHSYLDSLEGGFGDVLYGEALGVMFQLLEILRANVASND